MHETSVVERTTRKSRREGLPRASEVVAWPANPRVRPPIPGRRAGSSLPLSGTHPQSAGGQEPRCRYGRPGQVIDAVNVRPSHEQKYCLSLTHRSAGGAQRHSAPQPSGPWHTCPRGQSRFEVHTADAGTVRGVRALSRSARPDGSGRSATAVGSGSSPRQWPRCMNGRPGHVALASKVTPSHPQKCSCRLVHRGRTRALRSHVQ